MAKFKVGDRVRAKAGVTLFPVERFAGKTGVVDEIDGRFIYVVFDCGGRDAAYECNIELVESSTPTFAVGDRVRVTRMTSASHSGKRPLLGCEFTVSGTDGNSDYPYFLAGSGFAWSRDEIELVASVSPLKRTPMTIIDDMRTSTRIIPLELASIGDDRPAPNGDEFEVTMLAMLSEDKRDWSTVPQTAKAYEEAKKGEAA